MQEQSFTVWTFGKTVANISPTQVQQNLRAHLKLPEMHISAIFSGKRTVIKKNLDKITAEKYVAQFYRLGLVVEKEITGLPKPDTGSALPPH